MKITTLMLLGASILYLPQNAISAVGWTGQPAYGKNLESYPGQAYFTAPTVYGEAAEGGAFRPLRERPHPMPAPSNYRFRPWDGGYAGQRTVNKFIAPAGPASTRSVSYWGGAPVGRSQPMWRPPVGMPQQLSERNVSGNAPRTLPVPERLANQYIPGRYRFRPLRPARNMRETGQPHYRSLQVQIPERYIFRPLNPMRRSAPPVQVSQQQPYRPYSNGPFPDSGFWPHYPPTVQTLPDYRYAYGGFPMRGWYGAAPRYNSAPGWQMPYRPAIPPYYAQGMRMPARFRPLPEPLPDRGFQSNRYYRFAQRGNMPPPRYAPDAAYWRMRPSFPSHAVTSRESGKMAVQHNPHAVHINRYGTDWYDGRGDGDGAWYKLAAESWPTVTQRWEDEGAVFQETAAY